MARKFAVEAGEPVAQFPNLVTERLNFVFGSNRLFPQPGAFFLNETLVFGEFLGFGG